MKSAAEYAEFYEQGAVNREFLSHCLSNYNPVAREKQQHGHNKTFIYL
jgi:hypothetical protein